MDKAILVFSRSGLFTQPIVARDIHSREHYRKIWPLVADDGSRRLVTWVRPSFEGGQLQRRSHFRLLPLGHDLDIKQLFEQEESERQGLVHESKEHQRAKELIAAELDRRLKAGLGLPWAFNDPDASDFPLQGNLLLGANGVVMEHPLDTPFGSSYRLDIAVQGPPIGNVPMTLGGIEIEFSHAFDGRKALLGKSLGFPLITIDITEMALADITPEWASRTLSATTRSTEDGRRQTYVYLHDLLYPLYAQIPDFIDQERRHQFLIFTDDDTLQRLSVWLVRLSTTLGFRPNEVSSAVVNAVNPQSRVMLERAGAIAGSDWSSFNDHQCLRVTVPRSMGPADLRAHLFHMTMARLLLSHANALVGYKYANGLINEKPEEDIWVHKRWNKGEEGAALFTSFRVLPKRLAEPVQRLMQVIGELQDGQGE